MFSKKFALVMLQNGILIEILGKVFKIGMIFFSQIWRESKKKYLQQLQRSFTDFGSLLFQIFSRQSIFFPNFTPILRLLSVSLLIGWRQQHLQ